MSTLVPVAQSYLNYPGDVTSGLFVGQAKGPTTYGGLMYVVGWEYRADQDVTVVGMSAVNPVAADAQ